MDEPDPPGSNIHDGPNTSDTQRDEWLLKTEPLQGARPKWNIGERPPVVDDRTEVVDLEATGGVGGSECGATWTSGPSTTTQAADLSGGGGDCTTEWGAQGPGASPAPEPQVPPGGAQAVPQICMDVRSRDVGSDRRNDVWSLANVLVDTVARMQQDLANL